MEANDKAVKVLLAQFLAAHETGSPVSMSMADAARQALGGIFKAEALLVPTAPLLAPTPPAAWDEYAIKAAEAIASSPIMLGNSSRYRASIHVAIIEAMHWAASNAEPLVAATDSGKLTSAAIMELIDAQYLNGAIRLTWEDNNGQRVLTDVCKRFTDGILQAAGQVAPQATVTDEQIKDTLRDLAQDALDEGWKRALEDRSFPDEKEFIEKLVEAGARLIATPPTSKATEDKDLAYWISIGAGRYYNSFNRSFDASKADTGEISNADLETAIAHFERNDTALFFGSAVATELRAIKSATPSTIKPDHINDAVEMVWHQTEPKERSELEAAWLDREFATGFRSGWNAGVSGNETLLKTMESRIIATIAVIAKHRKIAAPTIKADVHPHNELIQAVDRHLSAAYQAGMDGDEFDMLTPKREIVDLATIKAEPTFNSFEEAWSAVIGALDAAVPDWNKLGSSAQDNAVRIIQELNSPPLPPQGEEQTASSINLDQVTLKNAFFGIKPAAVSLQGGAEGMITMPLKEVLAMQNKFYKQGLDDAREEVPQGGEAKAVAPDERISFEKWAVSVAGLNIERNDDDYVASDSTGDAWDAWQARAFSAAPAAQVLPVVAQDGAWHWVLKDDIDGNKKWVPARRNENHWYSAMFRGLTLSDSDIGPAIVMPVAADPIRQLVELHSGLLEENAELAYTRQTGWMAWLTDKPLAYTVVAPNRKIIANGQGSTPAEACAAAIAAMQGEKA